MHIFEGVQSQIIENRRELRYEVSERGTLGGVEMVVRNLSRTGAQLTYVEEGLSGAEAIPAGTQVTLELYLPDVVQLTGEIIYANDLDADHLVGVHFLQVGARERALIDQYIRSLW